MPAVFSGGEAVVEAEANLLDPLDLVLSYYRDRPVLPNTTPDEGVFRHAQGEWRIIIRCNRAHFLALAEDAVAAKQPFPGLVVMIRRRSRQAECAQLLQLLRQAGETGFVNNINFTSRR